MRTILGTLAVCVGLLASAASADVIAERKANFKVNGDSMKAMKAAIPAGDNALIAERARVIASWSSRMVDYFPEGSDEGDTSARFDIWADFDKFTELAKNAETAALELASLADGGAGAKDLANGLGKLGGTCKACHDDFKEDD